jgi:hypothetical protein
MTQHQISNVVDLEDRVRSGTRYGVDELGQGTTIVDLLPSDGRLLQIIPLPETGKAMMIVAHVVPAEVVETARAGTAPPDGRAGVLRLDRDSRRVWADGREVRLTFQEFELLGYLAAHPWTVFSRDELMNALWPDGEATIRTVDVHVHRLRRKLGSHGDRLATVRRVGYVYRPPGDRPVV